MHTFMRFSVLVACAMLKIGYSSTTYNKSIASIALDFSNAAYCEEAQILEWTCKPCVLATAQGLGSARHLDHSFSVTLVALALASSHSSTVGQGLQPNHWWSTAQWEALVNRRTGERGGMSFF